MTMRLSPVQRWLLLEVWIRLPRVVRLAAPDLVTAYFDRLVDRFAADSPITKALLRRHLWREPTARQREKTAVGRATRPRPPRAEAHIAES